MIYETQDVAKNWKSLGQISDKGHPVRNFLGLGIWTGQLVCLKPQGPGQLAFKDWAVAIDSW